MTVKFCTKGPSIVTYGVFTKLDALGDVAADMIDLRDQIIGRYSGATDCPRAAGSSRVSNLEFGNSTGDEAWEGQIRSNPG